MIKQVILYRRDLKMRKGKIAAQVAHASMKVFLDRGTVLTNRDDADLVIGLTPDMVTWVDGLFAKIVLSVETEDDLLLAHQMAKDAGIPTALIQDAGRTEFHGVPTNTTVALGPARSEAIDLITGPEGAVKTKLA